MATSRICSIPNCGKPHAARGWCKTHYNLWLRHGDPAGVGTKPGEPLRFYKEVVLPYRGDDCLIWPFVSNDDYARLVIGGRSFLVTRLVCEEAYGPPPTPEHEAAHSCNRGNFGCVSRSHLRWATHVENCFDQVLHGTIAVSERHGRAKLTNDEVQRIRALAGKMTRKEIASIFNVARDTIGSIHRGDTWRHLPPI